MSHAPSDLSTLVGSRICHDLISPLGAIGNGVELLELSTGIAGAEMALIAQSVEHAQARIRFFRVAFGTAASDQIIPQAEVQSILAEMSKGSRVNVDWNVPGDLKRRDVRLAFLLMLCCETALPVGGLVTVTSDGQKWLITAKAEKVVLDAALWSIFESAPAPETATAAKVHFPLAVQSLQNINKSVQIDHSTTELCIRF
jgi:histidine phosphotransferase ChpT